MKTVLPAVLMFAAFAAVVGCGAKPAPVASEKASNNVIQVPKTMPNEGAFKAKAMPPAPPPGGKVGALAPPGMPR